jgi:hypothetical protein
MLAAIRLGLIAGKSNQAAPEPSSSFFDDPGFCGGWTHTSRSSLIQKLLVTHSTDNASSSFKIEMFA